MKWENSVVILEARHFSGVRFTNISGNKHMNLILYAYFFKNSFGFSFKGN